MNIGVRIYIRWRLQLGAMPTSFRVGMYAYGWPVVTSGGWFLFSDPESLSFFGRGYKV
jgi:hypothetical protein